MNPKTKQFLIALFIVLVLAIFAFTLVYPVWSQSSARFQMIRIDNAGWFWSWSAEKPYTVIRPLCWDTAANNFCEPTLSFNRMTWIYEVIDWQDEKRITIYRLRRGGCIAWAWMPDYGSDGNPHMREPELIECPQ